MKILKKIAGPFAACLLAQHFPVMAILTTTVNFRQILEKQGRSVEQYRQRTVMIRGQGIESGLAVGEVLQEQGSHVPVKTPAIGHGRIVRALPPLPLTSASTDLPRHP